MAENGILDYQGMNQAIYRGATSNIVVDTQSMSIEIGAGNTSHTSNLHFECNHDANVASIKLNSNVVTEFPRSKKLIKYPRVAMTQNDESATSGYVASASSSNQPPYKVFDNILFTSYFEPVYTTNPYPNTDGAYTGGSGTVYDTNGYQGEYLQIQLPEKIKLYSYSISNRAAAGIEGRQPKDAKIFASNDGSTWIDIHTHRDGSGTYDTDGETRTFQLYSNPETYYKYYRLVVNSIIQGGTSDTPNISDWSLYGIPEYDPDAAGVDVKVTSYPNVPNTDWLEVYYDAKDLADGATTVNDLKPVGTANNGTVVGNTTVSDGAFVFDGAGDYIRGQLTSFGGEQTFTFSLWFNMVEMVSGSNNSIFQIGSQGSSEEGLGFRVYTGSVFRMYTWGGPSSFNVGTVLPKTWYHAVGTYSGGVMTLYVDGNILQSTSGSSLDLPTNPYFALGVQLTSSGTEYSTSGFKGSIANFRLFNRALTSDEVWQLYAYQKEYFGHGDLSMTLKAGCLGIGTSEPRAVLDVRGMAKYENVYYYASASDPSNFHNSGIPTYINVHERSNGGLIATDNGTKIQVTTPEAAGVYVVWCTVSVKTDGSQFRGFVGQLYKNDTVFAGGRDNLNHITSSTYTQIVSSGLIDLKSGDKVYHQTTEESAAKVHAHDTYFYMYRIST
jgi:hypothetical protein